MSSSQVMSQVFSFYFTTALCVIFYISGNRRSSRTMTHSLWSGRAKSCQTFCKTRCVVRAGSSSWAGLRLQWENICGLWQSGMVQCLPHPGLGRFQNPFSVEGEVEQIFRVAPMIFFNCIFHIKNNCFVFWHPTWLTSHREWSKPTCFQMTMIWIVCIFNSPSLVFMLMWASAQTLAWGRCLGPRGVHEWRG